MNAAVSGDDKMMTKRLPANTRPAEQGERSQEAESLRKCRLTRNLWCRDCHFKSEFLSNISRIGTHTA